MDSLEDKVVYAEQIDDIIGDVYNQYQNFQTAWVTEGPKYQKSLLAEVANELADLI